MISIDKVDELLLPIKRINRRTSHVENNVEIEKSKITLIGLNSIKIKKRISIINCLSKYET